MARRTKVYASAYSEAEPFFTTLEVDEKITYSVDWNAVLNSFSSAATISSSTWTQDSDAIVTLSGAASSSGVTSCLFTAVLIGRTVITNQVTLSNGEVREQKFAAQVIDSRSW
jgi:hypothetical protein